MTEGIKEYIEEVTTGIKCRGKYKKKIEDELSVHMETLYSDFLDRGYDIKRIEKMVIQAMGDPEDIRNSFNHVIWLKARKRIAKGVIGLTAFSALVLGVNSAVINMAEHEKYTTFLNGIEEGKVSVADALIDDLLTGAIETYCELVDNHHRIQLIVTKNVLITSEEGKYEEIR